MLAPLYSSAVTSFCFRLRPSQDLKKELLHFAQTHGLKAAVITSAVGSLKIAQLRLANGKNATTFTGPFEIVSATGTISADGVHIHISIADQKDQVLGGHLMEGCEIHTTAEIVLLENDDVIFTREVDPATGYPELVVRPRI